MKSKTWTLSQAKAQFSDVVARAARGSPQFITRRGRLVAVVAPAEAPKKQSKRSGSLADFFAASPLRGTELNLRRTKID